MKKETHEKKSPERPRKGVTSVNNLRVVRSMRVLIFGMGDAGGTQLDNFPKNMRGNILK